MTQSNDLRLWVGRQERRTDWINPNHLAAWNATLDRDGAFPRDAEPVPPGFHWTLFPPLVRQSELGPDGHPKKGGFLPPIPLPRRMWAGGQLRFHQPLRVGEKMERLSTIESVEEKHGKSGMLVFVTVRHILSGAQGPAIEERHDIVYREAPAAGAAPTSKAVEPAAAGAWQRDVVADEVLLFRYSALTFNGHRIHYDRRYVTEVEGYPGLVVHGPLIATLLLDLLRRQLPQTTLGRFSFKALRPTYDIGLLSLRGEPDGAGKHFRLWSTDNQRQTAMEAEAWIR
ncbi:MAG: acyl-CoA dehydrogenase [Rhodocyclaceae bacterium]|nr:MAG: acyl-CoA dehydrogenase [Rhodocyclaceae bacterium]